jgi:hypothetical protein
MSRPSIERLRAAVSGVIASQNPPTPTRPPADRHDYLFYGEDDHLLVEAIERDERECEAGAKVAAVAEEEDARRRRAEALDLDAAWDDERAKVVGRRRRLAREANERGEDTVLALFPDPPVERPAGWTPEGYRPAVSGVEVVRPKLSHTQRLVASREAKKTDTGIPVVVPIVPAGDTDAFGRPVRRELAGIDVLRVPHGAADGIDRIAEVEHYANPAAGFVAPDEPMTPEDFFKAAAAAKDDN